MSTGPTSRRFDLTGRVAMVTGGAGILGRHFCHGLAEHGAEVAVLDIDGSRAGALADEIGRQSGQRSIGIGVDLRDEAALETSIARIESELGPIDVLHNNAASKGGDLSAFFAEVEHFDMATWREIMEVNIDAMFAVSRAVGSRMAARRRGSIIQTASIYGIVGPDQRIYEGSQYMGRPINTPAVYSTSKAAVIGLTRHLATYWGHANVRVNTLTPGGVESGQSTVFQQRYGARVPLGRMAQAEEIVGALIFLASDASAYVTGQNIIVDGGLSVW